MIHRQEGDWHVYYEDDGEIEILRVKLPAEGVSMTDMQKFIDHLKKLAMQNEAGPN